MYQSLEFYFHHSLIYKASLNHVFSQYPFTQSNKLTHIKLHILKITNEPQIINFVREFCRLNNLFVDVSISKLTNSCQGVSLPTLSYYMSVFYNSVQ